ncbi:MAG: hypothetical protein FWE66_00855 [Oscillospiraceae bacterium]|nr:hypothetical protein [Oscillospiraceae bacterium]
MKNCPYCSTLNPDDAVFCSNCGGSVNIPAPPAQPFAQQNPGGYAPYNPVPPQAPQYATPYSDPYAPQKKGNPSRNWMGILAMILGILSFLICCVPYISLPFGLCGVIFGILGLKSQQRGMSIAGIITGVIGLIIAVVLLILVISMVAAPAWAPDWLENFYSDLYNQVNTFALLSR